MRKTDDKNLPNYHQLTRFFGAYLTYSKRSGVQAVNDGKWSEIKERVRHGVERGQLGQASYAESHPE